MSLQLSRLLISISFSSVLILLYSLRSFFDTLYALDLTSFSGPRVSSDGQTSGGASGRSAGSCRMSWMNPTYLRISSVESHFKLKYSLYLYREAAWDLDRVPSRSPILFIPGNAGSYRQVRSLASVTTTTYFRSPRSPHPHHLLRHHPGLDFFTLDFNDDFSALHGQTLVDQAIFTNDAIRSILSLYQQSRLHTNSHLPPPSSVLIIAHSMGGIVARRSLTAPNYLDRSINTIISLSSPHSIPPITFEHGIQSVYDRVNTLWRHSYSSRPQPSPLDEIVLVSISGGTSDTTVSSDSSSLLSLAPSDSSLTLFTTGIPTVWSPVDHLAILWCNQLATVMAKTLLKITDPRQSSQVGSVEERLRTLRSYLIQGYDIEPFPIDIHSALSKFRLESLPTAPKAFKVHQRFQSLRLTKPDFDHQTPRLQTHIIPLPSDVLPEYEFTLLTTFVANHQLNVLACNGSFEIDLLRSCWSISAHHSQLLPRSQFNLTPIAVPGPDDRAEPPLVFTSITVPLSQLYHSDFLAIQVERSSLPGHTFAGQDPDFLISEFRNLSDSTIVSTKSFLHINLWGASFELPLNGRSLVSEVRLLALVSSSLAYKLYFEPRNQCTAGGLFAPLMRQATPLLEESKFHPNIRSAVLYTHLSSAYVPVRSLSENEYGKLGVWLTFWMDPEFCGGSDDRVKVKIKLDYYETARKVLLRYRTASVSIPLGLVSLVLGAQLQTLRDTGFFPSFGLTLSNLTKRYLLKVFLIVGTLQCLQSIMLQTFHSGHHSESELRLVYHPRLVSDLLLGASEWSFMILDWLLIFLSIGWTALVYIIIETLLRSIGLFWMKFLHPEKPSKSKVINHPSPSSPTPISKRIESHHRVLIFLVGLGLFTVLFAPYHFSFMVLTTLQLIETFQSLVRSIPQNGSRVKGPDRRMSSYHYNLTILLMMVWLLPISVTTFLVWLRNLQEGWYRPFSGGRNILNMLGFMVLYYLNRLGSRHPQSIGFLSINHSNLTSHVHESTASLARSSRSMVVAEWVFRSIGIFSILYGIRWTYRIFDLMNLGCLSLSSVLLKSLILKSPSSI